jgi:hypothetical protein
VIATSTTDLVQIFECTCFLNRIGRTSTAVVKCDLIFVEGAPHIVFVWRKTDDGRREVEKAVPLERRFLRDLGQGRYLYRTPLVDLRA